MCTHILHPAIQGIELFESFVHFGLRHKIRLRPLFALGLRKLVGFAHTLTPFLLRQYIGLFPAVDFLHQRRDILRQADVLRKACPGAPEQPLTVHRLTAPVKFLCARIQHSTDRCLQRLRTRPIWVALQTADAL